METYVVLFLQRFEIRVYCSLASEKKKKKKGCTCTYIHNTHIHVHIRSIAYSFGHNISQKLGAH